MLRQVMWAAGAVVLFLLGVAALVSGGMLFCHGDDGVWGVLEVTSKNCQPRFCVVEDDFRPGDGGPVVGDVVLDGGPHEVGDRVRAFYSPGEDALVAHEEPRAWWLGPALGLVGGLVAVGSAVSLSSPAGARAADTRRADVGPARMCPGTSREVVDGARA